jgi:hypothetical protein
LLLLLLLLLGTACTSRAWTLIVVLTAEEDMAALSR